MKYYTFWNIIIPVKPILPLEGDVFFSSKKDLIKYIIGGNNRSYTSTIYKENSLKLKYSFFELDFKKNIDYKLSDNRAFLFNGNDDVVFKKIDSKEFVDMFNRLSLLNEF